MQILRYHLISHCRQPQLGLLVLVVLSAVIQSSDAGWFSNKIDQMKALMNKGKSTDKAKEDATSNPSDDSTSTSGPTILEEQASAIDEAYFSCIEILETTADSKNGKDAGKDQEMTEVFRKHYSCKAPSMFKRFKFNLFRRKQKKTFEACIKKTIVESISADGQAYTTANFDKDFGDVTDLLRNRHCQTQEIDKADEAAGEQTFMGKMKRLANKYAHVVAEMTARFSGDYQACVEVHGNTTLEEFFCDPARKEMGQFMNCTLKAEKEHQAAAESEQANGDEDETRQSAAKPSPPTAKQKKTYAWATKVANKAITKLVCNSEGKPRQKRGFFYNVWRVVTWPFRAVFKLAGWLFIFLLFIVICGIPFLVLVVLPLTIIYYVLKGLFHLIC